MAVGSGFSNWIMSLLGLLTTQMPPFAINSSAVSTNLGQSALLPLELKPLPLGSIKPAGWLRNELQLMSEGLAGHEHDFYDYVAHSLWLGGDKEYSGLNEGFPYWFNGIVPLAYGLDDERLKEQVRSSVQTVFEAQQDDGWLGPEKNVEDRNLWARFPFFLGLIQLAEADGSWTQPVVEKLHAFVPLMNSMLKDDFAGYYPEKDRKTCSIGNCGSNWGRIRMQDCMITLQWLYEYHPGNQSQMLLDNMKLLHDAGLNWEAWYTEDEYFGRGFDKDQWITNPHGTHDDPDFPFQHGVNVGQGFKAPAVVRRWNHNDSLITTAANGVNWTMQYHGSASGSILADERLVGLSPYSGSELCTTVETIYSFSYLYQALGINHYADSAELAAFNALPAAMAPDHWAHQYMTQPNQPYAEPLKQTPFYNVNNRSTIFGLEPQYVCCTVNHPQGWPKFLSNSWVRVGMTGIAHALLSPSSVNATVGGGNVKITCETAYPFLDQLVYTIEASQPCSFYVRVPEWAGSDSSIAIDQKASSALSPDNGTGLHRIAISEGTTKITYTLTSSIRTEPRANETVAVYKGALLYALEISNTNTSTLPNNPAGTATYPSDYAPPECRDFSYHNTSAWNYAIDPSTLQYVNPVASSSEETSTYELPNPVWAPRAAPGYIEVEGCKIDWPLYLDSIPGYPPVGDAKNCIAEKEKLRLVPYGTTKTHMSDLPVIELGSVEGVGAV